jgi:hypothetical protein
VEVTIGLLVFTITALGSLYYRYATALSQQIAQQQLTAADLAVTFIEAWQGVNGSITFDPDSEFSSYLAITPAAGGSAPSGYTLRGTYEVVIRDRTYEPRLYWKDVASGLRELGVAVSWPVGSGGQEKTYRLTAYARL